MGNEASLQHTNFARTAGAPQGVVIVSPKNSAAYIEPSATAEDKENNVEEAEDQTYYVRFHWRTQLAAWLIHVVDVTG